MIPQLDKIISLFNNEDVKRFIYELQNISVIAGGAVVYALSDDPRCIPGDIDFFMPSEEHFETMLCKSRFINIQKKYMSYHKYQNVISIVFEGENHPIQLVLKKHQTPSDITDGFDIDYVKCAIYKNKLYVTKECAAAIKDKRIHKLYSLPRNMGSRLNKAVDKGFSCPVIGDIYTLEQIEIDLNNRNDSLYDPIGNKYPMQSHYDMHRDIGYDISKFCVVGIDGRNWLLKHNAIIIKSPYISMNVHIKSFWKNDSGRSCMIGNYDMKKYFKISCTDIISSNLIEKYNLDPIDENDIGKKYEFDDYLTIHVLVKPYTKNYDTLGFLHIEKILPDNALPVKMICCQNYHDICNLPNKYSDSFMLTQIPTDIVNIIIQYIHTESDNILNMKKKKKKKKNKNKDQIYICNLVVRD